MFRKRKDSQLHDGKDSPDARPLDSVAADAGGNGVARRQPPQLPSRPLTSSGYPMEYGRKQVEARTVTSKPEKSATKPERDRCMTVGREVQLTGKVSACDQITVDGFAEITLNDARLLQVGESGCFKGHVDVADADIAGRFEGNLTVRNKLTVRSTAHISGVIRYGHIIVDAGAQLAGEINSLQEAETAKVSPPKTSDRVTEAGERSVGSQQVTTPTPIQIAGQYLPTAPK